MPIVDDGDGDGDVTINSGATGDAIDGDDADDLSSGIEDDDLGSDAFDQHVEEPDDAEAAHAIAAE